MLAGRWVQGALRSGVAGLVLGAWSGLGLAGEPASVEAPTVALDKLMKLPDSYRADPTARRGKGLSAQQWRDRFAAADRDLARAQKDLANAQAAQEKQASSSSSWQMSAPGLLGGGAAAAEGEKAPVSFRLREGIRKRKAAVEKAKRAQRDLVVEANLASVPEDWRRPKQGAEAGADSEQ